MKYLRKIWIRILLSLIIGGILAEMYHLMHGTIEPRLFNTLLYMGAVVTFILLSAIVWGTAFLVYLFPSWFSEEELDKDILDKDL